MDEHVSLPRGGPSLRIARLTVENFRAIREPIEIAFGDSPEGGDPIVVFHGRNGAGKSTALLALALALGLLQRGWGDKAKASVGWTTKEHPPSPTCGWGGRA